MDLASRPADNLVSITPSDSDVLSPPIRAIYVGAGGDVAITDMKGNDVTLVGLTAGVFHPIYASKVLSTGTTATDIVGARI